MSTLAKAWAAVTTALAAILAALVAWLWWQSRRERRARILAVGDAAAAQHEARAEMIEEGCRDETKAIEKDDVRGLVSRLRDGVDARMRERASKASPGKG